MRGFSLIEILLVIAISAVLLSMSVPVGMDLYRGRQLDDSSQGLVQSLRNAQAKAMSVEQDSSFGIYLTEGGYTLFRGASWDGRAGDYDEIFTFGGGISAADTPREIIFSKVEGTPSWSGDIVLNGGGETRTININSFGVINFQ